MPDTKPGRRDAFEYTKHPLAVLLFTTLIGSAAVPYVTRAIADHSQRNEMRSSLILEILEEQAEIESLLNAFSTDCLNLIKGVRWSNDRPNNYQNYINSIQSKLDETYQDFNRKAWWWLSMKIERARILNLVDSENADAMQDACRQYIESLTISTTDEKMSTSRLHFIVTDLKPGQDFEQLVAEAIKIESSLKDDAIARSRTIASIASRLR